MTPSKEFSVGNHSIGWMNDRFVEFVKDAREIETCLMPTFQKLPRNMTDAQIESELKPGLCGLNGVLAFLDNAPEECKDGYANLFYFPGFVVRVRWYSSGRHWRVVAWRRDGRRWFSGGRVCTPATGAQTLSPESSETLTLEQRIKSLEEWRERVQN